MGVIFGLLALNAVAFVFLVLSLEERHSILSEKKFISNRSGLSFDWLSGLKLLIILAITIQSIVLLK